jgi:lon-related putative ATP-dependent protease
MEKLLELREKEAKKVIDLYLDKIRNRFSDNKKLMNHFAEMTEDMISHLEEFVKASQQGKDLNIGESFFLRYLVNPLIYHEPNDHDAPLILAANPTYENLFGTVTYRLQNNLVYTDHMQIRMGSIHEANGGYMILQAYDLLKNPYAWEGLKRVLKNESIAIEPINLNTLITRVLKPEPIPLKVKVILIGDPRLYYLLLENDPDFAKLFKIRADFELDMPRTEENMVKMGKFVRFQCQENRLLPFDHTAMAAIVEFSSRAVENQDRLSTEFSLMADLMIQAEALALQDGKSQVTAGEIRAAIDQRNQRNNKYEERLLKSFESGDLILDTHGKVVGQINGLTVMDSGEYRFGMPSRITVSTYAGEEGVVNIEREIERSGAIHDKGVMIIAGYLGSKFAVHNPLALSSSITFEQSYSYIDGDSASSTELYGLISSLSEVPIKQFIAVTGSVNQKGEIQPIGGVNEKIEGFFKVCKIKGFKGGEGVMIPIQNVKNLMLSDEVIQAVEAGAFAIYAVRTIDEGIEILMDGQAGTADENGEYPPGTIFGMVQDRIDYFAQLMKNQDE